MKYGYCYRLEIGELCIVENDGEITNLIFSQENLPRDFKEEETLILKKAKQQLDEYLLGQRKIFDLPLSPSGTDFQQKVWKELLNIQYGETVCYSEIAERIGNPKGSRAIGMANNKNPIAIFIPCHRVIGKNGKLVGYAGGLKIKEYLLSIEKE